MSESINGVPTYKGRTIGEVLEYVFRKAKWREFGSNKQDPLNPPDVFLAAAYLLQTSGYYRYLFPGSVRPFSQSVDQLGGNEHFSSHLRLEDSFYKSVCKSVREICEILDSVIDYTGGPEIRGEWLEEKFSKAAEKQEVLIADHWKNLVASENELVYAAGSFVRDNCIRYFDIDDNSSEKSLKWVMHCFELLVISDMLCAGIGFPVDVNKKIPSISALRSYSALMESVERISGGGGIEKRYVAEIQGLCAYASDDVGIVMPKSLAPTVGCTMRSLSHNLSFLPPRGETEVRWYPAVSSVKSDRTPFNILIIPFPYEIDDRAFSVSHISESSEWGLFEVKPTWLDKIRGKDFVSCVEHLAKQARELVGKVDAIVFPEASLRYINFKLLIKEIQEAKSESFLKDIEFIVAGLCDRGSVAGNYVGCATFHTVVDNDSDRHETISFSTLRGKHHRWKMGKTQLDEYRLSHILNNGMDWWESMPIDQRVVDFFVFRKSSSFAVLVCEDLARIDPCQQIVRAVGPDLVIAILMDSVQINKRWPARYATVLADDPGSSVLTVTSYGLVERSSKQRERQSLQDNRDADRTKKPSRAIALWKESNASAREIDLADGAAAVVLTLANYAHPRSTLDGRNTSIEAELSGRRRWLWQLTDVHQVSIADKEQAMFRDFGRFAR